MLALRRAFIFYGCNFETTPNVKLYKYWAKGEATVQSDEQPWQVWAHGSSNESLEDAKVRAQKRAEQTAAAIASGRPLDTYAYSDRPLREETIREIRDGDAISAVITRNAYGSLVLNTNRVMFVDIDIYPESGNVLSLGESLRRVWATLRGRGAEARLERTRQREQRIFARFDEVSRSHPELGFRIYRTSDGFRLLITSGTYDPAATSTLALLKAFDSDPLYIRLCKAQECFRARLSAKFWRCGAQRPPSRFPWDDPAKEQEYRAWEEDYHRLANKFAVCQLVESRGASTVDESVLPILDVHDRLTIQDGATLA